MTEQQIEDFDPDNTTLDEVEDLPTFGVWPTGAYLVTLTEGVVEKEINEKKMYELAYTLDQVMDVQATSLTKGKDEGTGDQEEPPKPGDVMQSLFQKTPEGMKYLKPILQSVALGLNAPPVTKFSQLFKMAKGVKALMVITRTWKKDVSRHNFRIIKFVLV